MTDIFTVMNILIVLVGFVTIYCSIRLARCLNKYSPNFWWYVCPTLVIWGVLNRALIAYFDVTAGSGGIVADVAALNLLWWVGITVFIRQVRISTEKLLAENGFLKFG